MPPAPEFRELLVQHQSGLLGFIRRHGSGVLRFESDEDLLLGIQARALERESRFEMRSEKEFLAYLHQLAANYIRDRHEYWCAAKRGLGKVLRFSYSRSGGSSGSDSRARLPATASAGPQTYASRREALVLATRALSLLPDRDRTLVRWMSEAMPIADQAEQLGVSYAAAQRAGLRAIERFRKTFEAIGG